MNTPTTINGIQFSFFNTVVNQAEHCNYLPGNYGTYCKKYAFNIQERTSSTLSTREQGWRIHVELRHAPGEENEGSCWDSKHEDLITYQNIKQEKDYYIKANPFAKPICARDGNVCRPSCQFYVDDAEENAKTSSTKSIYECPNGNYCCETSLPAIEQRIKEEQG